jgi:hypothetical protein
MQIIAQAPAAGKIVGPGTGFQIFAELINSAIAAILNVPGSGRLEGQQFIVRAGGRLFVHGTSPTVNFAIYNGSSLTPGSDTAITTLASAQSLTTNATYPWAIELEMQGDSTSGILQVMSSEIVCNGVSGTPTNTDQTSVNFQAGATSGTTEPALSLVVGVDFTVADSTDYAVLDQFSLEA